MALVEVGSGDSTAAGPALDVLSELVGGPRVDDLLRRAADRRPLGPALRTVAGDVGYAELDARVERCAAALRALAGDDPAAIALATTLDPAFATAFFGISRAGRVPALFNPLLREEGLVHVLGVCEAGAAVVPPEVNRVLAGVRDRLPALRHIVLTHREPGHAPDPSGPPTLDELIDAAPGGPWGAPLPVAGEDDVACIQFTSGSTGAPKAVLLTHRNITVNAAQSAHAHGLTDSSVAFDYLPTFHLMHLTMAVTLGIPLVLWTDPDIPAALDAAGRYGATHFYSLPVRLARLAVEPRLGELEAPALRAFLSGGSALPRSAVTALTQHFGVPVVQGYGLQETSPSTHFDSLASPTAGSSGRPVAGTECRIVEVDTRRVLPSGADGEIQVRGPQLMKGYLGRDRSLDVDPDGWFSTGDIGRVEEDGLLFVLDRIKDVFKRDNWLVSPTQIERVLIRHPDVAECAVVDRPEAFSGAVAHGFVVPAPGRRVDPAALAREINAGLAYYEHLEHIDLIDHIPRTPTGKVSRQELRRRVREPSATKERHTMHVFVNRFTLTGDRDEFERLLEKITDYMAAQPGFRSYQLNRSAQDPAVYVEVAEWDGPEDHKRAVGGEGFRGPVMEVMKLAQAEPGPFVRVVQR